MQQRLSAGLARRDENRRYWEGRQPLAFLAPEARAALGNRMGVLSVNFPRVAIDVLRERLRLNGFDGDGSVWAGLIGCDYDQVSDTLHCEALLQGEAFVIVWADSAGKPVVSIESGDTVAVKRDDVTREVVAAVKQVRIQDSPATEGRTETWLYLPDRVEHWRSNASGGSGEFDLIETVPNPLGVVPVVPFTNSDLLPACWKGNKYLEYSGESEIQPLKNLVDGLNKTLADMAVAQEFTARPRRWATGIEATEVPATGADGEPLLDDDGAPLMETINPIPEGSRAMFAEDSAAKFGQLEGANLAGFKTAVDIWVQAIQTVSALPAHMCGITTANPATSEAMQAAEAGLTAKAEAKAKLFGRSHEQVARLYVAVRDGVSVQSVSVRAVWGPFNVRSEAAAADAATKLYGSGLLSRRATLRRLGFSEEEIAAELEAINKDAQDNRDIALGTAMSQIKSYG